MSGEDEEMPHDEDGSSSSSVRSARRKSVRTGYRRLLEEAEERAAEDEDGGGDQGGDADAGRHFKDTAEKVMHKVPQSVKAKSLISYFFFHAFSSRSRGNRDVPFLLFLT